MQIFVQGSDLTSLDVSPITTVGDVKELVAYQSGISTEIENLVLTFGGHPLEDEFTLSDCNVQQLSTISLSVRLLGGKVHGSLARAGKVKGQTPKVDKQEKKKNRTGRAKRRQQYNQRFVNYVQQFGRRRGPNSNA